MDELKTSAMRFQLEPYCLTRARMRASSSGAQWSEVARCSALGISVGLMRGSLAPSFGLGLGPAKRTVAGQAKTGNQREYEAVK